MSEAPAAGNALEAAANAVTGNALATTDQGNPEPDIEGLGDAGKKALDLMKSERNDAKRQAAELKAKLDRLEAANLSDLERAQKEAKDASELAAAATQEARRYRIAAEFGIDSDAELILTAPDEETMRRQATLWSQRTATTSTAPKPDLTQGAQHAPALNSDALTQALERAVGR